MQNRIELAESAIKHLRDFIEVEKMSKKVVTDQAKKTSCEFTQILVASVENILKNIKGEQ